MIALGRTAGFSLDDIVVAFGPQGDLRVDRAALLGKADELDRTITQLTAVRDGLRHAAACPAPSHAECPTFRHLLREVMAGRIATIDALTP
ncbi:MerR family DNA-binding protein [Nocardia sp. NPDC059229]|uniref:MerR family DNA-binding protein n=1 Tax=Nocardia sp. NPDC059229 TaxID=3346778 RepID=UPI0036A99467